MDTERLDWLADLPDEQVPDAVARSLDAVVARLASERRASRDADPTPTRDPWGKSTPTPVAKPNHSPS